jgi:hypothetical protein
MTIGVDGEPPVAQNYEIRGDQIIFTNDKGEKRQIYYDKKKDVIDDLYKLAFSEKERKNNTQENHNRYTNKYLSNLSEEIYNIYRRETVLNSNYILENNNVKKQYKLHRETNYSGVDVTKLVYGRYFYLYHAVPIEVYKTQTVKTGLPDKCNKLFLHPAQAIKDCSEKPGRYMQSDCIKINKPNKSITAE